MYIGNWKEYWWNFDLIDAKFEKDQKKKIKFRLERVLIKLCSVKRNCLKFGKIRVTRNNGKTLFLVLLSRFSLLEHCWVDLLEMLFIFLNESSVSLKKNLFLVYVNYLGKSKTVKNSEYTQKLILSPRY